MRFHDIWTEARIVRVQDVSPTIRLLEIDAGEHFQRWTPGSHLRMHVRVEDRVEIRTYSLVDLGDDARRYRIAVKLMEGGLGGSRYMWRLAAGDVIEVSQPHNHFEMSRYGSSYTLVAGGVGITPFVSMARTLTNRGQPVRLFYGVRNRDEAAFEPLLREWLGDSLTLCVAEESGALDLAQIIDSIAAGGEMYLCGPIAMLEAAARLWTAAGRPLGLLRYETFASSGHYPTRPFQVELPRFGKTVEVPAHQTLMAALSAEGIELMSDCKRGECGLCVVDVLASDGPIDHRDVFLTRTQKDEGRKLCACVSRLSGGTIKLDTGYRGKTVTAT